MSDGKSVEIAPTDKEEGVIWTFGLGGCSCSVVFTEQEDGTRNCVLTHYPPTELSVNMAKLGDLISSEKMTTAKTKKAVLVAPTGGADVFSPADCERRSALSREVKPADYSVGCGAKPLSSPPQRAEM